MQRDRIKLAEGREIPVWCAAVSHIVLSVNFEKTKIRLALEQRIVMLRLKTNAATVGILAGEVMYEKGRAASDIPGHPVLQCVMPDA